jgi:hypothetical protein
VLLLLLLRLLQSPPPLLLLLCLMSMVVLLWLLRLRLLVVLPIARSNILVVAEVGSILRRRLNSQTCRTPGWLARAAPATTPPTKFRISVPVNAILPAEHRDGLFPAHLDPWLRRGDMGLPFLFRQVPKRGQIR